MEIDTIINPDEAAWDDLIQRPVLDFSQLEGICNTVFEDVKNRKDKALFDYTLQFDKVQLNQLQVSEKEIKEASGLVSAELKDAILIAKDNISRFHNEQKAPRIEVRPMDGILCRQESRAIEKVGIYVPGGTAPLFSTVLMLAIPATIAGCEEIIMCTPPNQKGEINPAILYTANLCGITKIFKLGGIQAIAAMAMGSETVPSVYKIFGPGNQYVMAAKQLAMRKAVAIDMPAGPSELLVIADETAIPKFVASDLLSQAEHGADSQVVLLTTHEYIANEVKHEIALLLTQISRQEVAKKALSNSRIIVFDTVDQCIRFSNRYAPEHLILAVKDYNSRTSSIRNAGSVFLGNYTPESAGDYASGTNHTLPTNGYAKAYSGVNLDAFVTKITFQEISPQGMSILSRTIETMAENELLEAHALAAKLRRLSVD